MERFRHYGQYVALVVILAVAVVFRLNGIGWDRGYLFHPDERQIIFVAQRLHLPSSLTEFLSSESPLNPRFFAYGSLPIYLLRLLSPIAPQGIYTVPERDDSMAALALLGRILSIVFDLGLISTTFLLGRRLFGVAVGLIAATAMVFSVLDIQLAHFYAVDTILSFFIILTFHLTLRWSDSGRRRDAILTGVAFGLAMATKVTAAPLIVPIAFAAVRARDRRANGPLAPRVAANALVVGDSRRNWVKIIRERAVCLWREGKANLWRVRRDLGLVVGVAFLVFVVTQPYFLLDPIRFFGQVGTELLVARGWLDYPYTRQYANRLPFIYQIVQSSIWGMGLPLGLAAWAGSALFVYQWWKTREWRTGLVVSFALVYLLTIGGQFAKYLRYLLPALPFLFIMAAAAAGKAVSSFRLHVSRATSGGVEVLAGSSDSNSKKPAKASTLRTASYVSRFTFQWLAIVLAILILVPTVAYAIAFDRLYAQEHPWLQISEWIYRHIPKGATLVEEQWDDSLPEPVQIDGRARLPNEYQIKTLSMYDADDPAKLNLLIATIEQTDYIVLASQRLYATISRLPTRYPISSRYYRALFDGRLGFQLVAFARRDISFGRIIVVDNTFSEAGLAIPSALETYSKDSTIWDWGRADESFTVYDHPIPLVFCKTRSLDSAELKALLTSPATVGFDPSH